MRVLISGITGFVGRHLASALASGGHEVWGFSSEALEPEEDVRVLEADLLDPKTLADVVERCRPEAIVHLAGLSHVGESWKRPGDYLRVNFAGTCNLLRAAGGRRTLFASSAEVYGCVPDDEQPIGEDRPLDPRSPYAMTKACAERIAADAGAVIVRSFNAIGPGQSRRFALPSFAAQLAKIAAGKREPVLRVGDLSPRRDFLHVEDAVAGYRTLLERGEPGTVYNLASGEAHSIAEALDGLRAISGVDAEVRREEARVRLVDIPLLAGDAGRLRALGWEPRHDFAQALREIWEEALAAEREGRGPAAP